MASVLPRCVYCGAEMDSPGGTQRHMAEAHPGIIARGRMVADCPGHSWTLQVWPLVMDKGDGAEMQRIMGFYADIGDS